MASSSSLNDNPWCVESLQAFTFLNCPECDYRSKEETAFQNHAVENHPKSRAFFGLPFVMVEIKEEPRELEEEEEEKDVPPKVNTVVYSSDPVDIKAEEPEELPESLPESRPESPIPSGSRQEEPAVIMKVKRHCFYCRDEYFASKWVIRC